jgi:membrane fusion protein, copper/silver efflux system
MKKTIIFGAIIAFGLGIGVYLVVPDVPTGDIPVTLISEPNKKALDQTLDAYFKIQQALSHDKLTDAQYAAHKTPNLRQHILMEEGDAKGVWQRESINSHRAFKAIEEAADITLARKAFENLTASIEKLIGHFGGPQGQSVRKYYCPMVDGDRGASWLQNIEGTENPYFGSKMFKCGHQVKQL